MTNLLQQAIDRNDGDPAASTVPTHKFKIGQTVFIRSLHRNIRGAPFRSATATKVLDALSQRLGDSGVNGSPGSRRLLFGRMPDHVSGGSPKMASKGLLNAIAWLTQLRRGPTSAEVVRKPKLGWR